MVTLDILRASHEHDHKLVAFCPTRDRWAVLDFERLIVDGRGEYCFVGRRPRCGYCSGPGDWQVRPPTLRPGRGGRPYV